MFDNHHHWGQAMKGAGDFVSISVVLGTLASVLPSMAALLSIVWSAIRIWETRTVQRWLGRGE